jgi:hypothetical protein
MEYTGCDDCVHANLDSCEEPCNSCIHARGGDEHFEPKATMKFINAKLDKIIEYLGI